MDTKRFPKNENQFNPNVVILSDTKELCHQTNNILKKINFDKIKSSVLLTSSEKSEFIYDSNIIVTTLGSFFSFLNKKQLTLDNLEFLVFDETDKLFTQDYSRNKITNLFKKINSLDHFCRIGMFSATFTESCLQEINALGRKVAKLVVQKEDLNLKNLTHFYIKCSRQNKLEFMNRFLMQYQVKFFEGSVIIFVNSKNFADQFATKLIDQGHKCEILTNDLSDKDRISIMEEFKQGKIKILLTTNLIARGIDNRKVNLVINLDLPYHFSNNHKDKIDVETYIHRVGRTGRFGDKGIALNIVENDRDLNEIRNVNQTTGIKFLEVTLENFSDVIKQSSLDITFNQQKRTFLEENI